MTANDSELRRALAHALGSQATAWEPVVALAPEVAVAALPWLSTPRERAALTDLERALVLLAVDTCSPHRDEESVRAHVKDALAAGATHAAILEAAELASILGMHSLTFGLPVVDDQWRRFHGNAPDSDQARAEQLRGDHLDGPYWERFEEHLGDFTDAVLRLDPTMFEAFMTYTTRVWRDGELEPLLKELIYVALDLVAEHQYEPGLRIHVHNALALGASMEQLVEVIELVSLQGFQGLTLTARVLQEEADR